MDSPLKWNIPCSSGLWDQGVYRHFCDTRKSPLYMGGWSLGGPFCCITEVVISHSPAVHQLEADAKGTLPVHQLEADANLSLACKCKPLKKRTSPNLCNTKRGVPPQRAGSCIPRHFCHGAVHRNGLGPQEWVHCIKMLGPPWTSVFLLVSPSCQAQQGPRKSKLPKKRTSGNPGSETPDKHPKLPTRAPFLAR